MDAAKNDPGITGHSLEFILVSSTPKVSKLEESIAKVFHSVYKLSRWPIQKL